MSSLNLVKAAYPNDDYSSPRNSYRPPNTSQASKADSRYFNNPSESSFTYGKPLPLLPQDEPIFTGAPKTNYKTLVWSDSRHAFVDPNINPEAVSEAEMETYRDAIKTSETGIDDHASSHDIKACRSVAKRLAQFQYNSFIETAASFTAAKFASQYSEKILSSYLEFLNHLCSASPRRYKRNTDFPVLELYSTY